MLLKPLGDDTLGIRYESYNSYSKCNTAVLRLPSNNSKFGFDVSVSFSAILLLLADHRADDRKSEISSDAPLASPI